MEKKANLASEASREKLLFTDNDSLCYEIETEDFFQDISNDVEKDFDTSNHFQKIIQVEFQQEKTKKFPD